MNRLRFALFTFGMWLQPLQAEVQTPLISLPVQVHLIRSTSHPRLQAQVTETELKGILGEVNDIWAQAGIRFELKGVDELKARGIALKKWFQRDRNWVKAAIPTDQFSPLAIDVCFVHDMGPNGFFYGEPVVVCENPEFTEVRGGSNNPVARVLAHELGHVLFLVHRQDHVNLMASGRNGVGMNRDEIKKARQRALQLAVQLSAH